MITFSTLLWLNILQAGEVVASVTKFNLTIGFRKPHKSGDGPSHHNII